MGQPGTVILDRDTGEEFLPVEPGGTGVEHLAVAAAPAAGLLPDQVAALLDQQGFVAADQVGSRQFAAEVGVEFIRIDAQCAAYCWRARR